MPVPPNITSATAIALTNPTSITQDVRDVDTGIVHTVWYKYTETVEDRVIDFKFYGIIGGDNTTYRPTTNIFTDPAGVQFTNTAANCQGQLPILLGQTYYFRVFRNNAGIAAAILNIEFAYAPSIATVPTGSIFIRPASIPSNFINDEGFTGLPAGFIDTAADSIIDFIPYFIAGESGDVLPATGKMLYADESGSLAPFPVMGYNVYLYNSDFTLSTSFVFDPDSNGPPLIRTHNPSNKFYIISKGNSSAVVPVTFRSVDVNGALGTAEALTAGTYGCTAHAVNNAETILYIAGIGGSLTGSNIKRWDIINDVFLSDLAPVETDHQVTDILVLSDDSVVACYFKPSVTRATFVRRYSSAGAVLNTYTFTFAEPITGVDPRLGYASGTPEVFWVFFHTKNTTTNAGYVDLRKIRVSDGVELVTSITKDTSFELYEASGAPFALTSDSCPVIELRAAIGPTPPSTLYGGIYTIVPGKLNDTVNNAGVELDVEIPDPTFRTGLIG